MRQRACSQRNESRSENRFGSWSASWLGLWFELCAFTSTANAVPITNRICALRGNSLFLLRSPRWLTHAWLQHAFPKCARTNHVPTELCVHKSSESGFLRKSRSITPLFSRFKTRFKSLIWKSFAFTKGKTRLSNQERVWITFRNGFRNVIRSFVNRPIVQSILTPALTWSEPSVRRADKKLALQVQYIPFRGRPASCRDSSTALLRSSSKLELPPAEKRCHKRHSFQ